jgi:hypothetical protein
VCCRPYLTRQSQLGGPGGGIESSGRRATASPKQKLNLWTG